MPFRKKKNLEQKSNAGLTNKDTSSKQQEEPPSSTDKKPDHIKESESDTHNEDEQNVQEKPETISDTSDNKSDDIDAQKMQEKSTDVKKTASDTESTDKSQSSDDPVKNTASETKSTAKSQSSDDPVKNTASDTKSTAKSQSSDDPEVDGIYKCVSQPPTFERHLVSRYQFIKRNDTYAMRKGANVNNGPNVLVLSQSEMLDIKNPKMEEDYHIVSITSGKYRILYPSLSEIIHHYKR